MNKKFLAKLMIFCMVFTMLPFSAFAADVNTQANATYTVTYDANGGALAEGVATTYTVDADTELALPTATKAGSTLAGWSYVRGDSTTKVADPYKVVCDTTLFALWDVAVVTIDTVSALVNGEADELISVAVKDNQIVVTGTVAKDATVTISYTTSEKEDGTFTITYDAEKDQFVASVEKIEVGEGYTIDLTGLTAAIEGVVVATEPKEVEVEIPEGVTGDQLADMTAAAAAFEGTTAEDILPGVVSMGGLAEIKGNADAYAIKGSDETVTKKALDDAKAKLATDKGLDVEAIDVVTYTDLTPTLVPQTGEYNAKRLTFSIQPTLMIMVATTTNPNEMTADNSALVKAVKYEVTTTVTLNLPVSDDFAAMFTGVTPYVRHAKAADKVFYYVASVVETLNGKVIQFENPNGFSEFTVMADFEPAAQIGTEVYESLQEAVNAVKDGQTITLLKAITEETTITVSQAVTFYIDVAGLEANFTVVAGNGYRTGEGHDADAHHYVFVTAGGGGGGSSSSNVSIATKVIGGKVTVTPNHPSKGQTVTIKVAPAEGFKLDTLVVTDRDGKTVELTKVSDTEYTFVMPAGKVTVTPTFVQIDENEKKDVETPTFTDIKAGDWFAPYVEYVVEKGMMKGYEDGRFGPNDNTTRAQIVTVLYRLEGEPAVSKTASFNDVADGQYYSDPVAWAAANGIVNGYNDTQFAPSENVTREQVAAILYRYAAFKNVDTSAVGNTTKFSDGASVSSWGVDAIAWAVGDGLINGDDTGALRPQGNATRAEIAALLMRFCENIMK